MFNDNEYTLDYLFSQEIKVMQEKYNRSKTDLETKRYLYEQVIQANRQLPSLKEEREYLSTYKDFDR